MHTVDCDVRARSIFMSEISTGGASLIRNWQKRIPDLNALLYRCAISAAIALT